MDNKDLVFICAKCKFCTPKETDGCEICSNHLFRVAYKNLPLIESPLNDPYRTHDTEEDGYKLNTPYGEGQMSNSALGDGGNSGDVGMFHEPGDAFDRNMSGGNSSNFYRDDEPLGRPKNIRDSSIFSRIRNRKKII
jgi:hypothetical protein